MRFIRQEEIITTICNTEVKEEEHLVSLFEKLKEEGIYFALSIRKMYHSDYTDHIITYSKANVKDVDAEKLTVDFYVYTDSSLIKMNKVSFDDISEIYALTKKSNLLECGRDKGFFHYIDLED